MRVHIISDIEGVGGIVKGSQCGGDSPLYQEGRVLYTEEINAAVRGAKAAGATEIVVMDWPRPTGVEDPYPQWPSRRAGCFGLACYAVSTFNSPTGDDSSSSSNGTTSSTVVASAQPI